MPKLSKNKLTAIGRLELLNTFISKSYYLGLLYNNSTSTFIFSNRTSLLYISGYEPLDRIEYKRIVISPSDWLLESNLVSITFKSNKTFNPKMQKWENIQGYFISSSDDNTGYLVYIYVFNNKVTINKNGTLNINPRIYF